jgi:hypothetical protein
LWILDFWHVLDDIIYSACYHVLCEKDDSMNMLKMG